MRTRETLIQVGCFGVLGLAVLAAGSLALVEFWQPRLHYLIKYEDVSVTLGPGSLEQFHGEKIGRLRNGQPAQSARPFQNFLKPGAIRSGSPGEAFDRGRVEIECMTVCSQYASKKQNAAPDGAAPIRCS